MDTNIKKLNEGLSERNQKEIIQFKSVVLNNISQCFIKLKKYTESKEFATLALELNPNNWKSFFKLGKISKLTKNFK